MTYHLSPFYHLDLSSFPLYPQWRDYLGTRWCKVKARKAKQEGDDTKLHSQHQISRGQPLPLGATLKPNGVNFSIFSRNATSVTLVLVLPDKARARLEFPLDSRFN